MPKKILIQQLDCPFYSKFNDETICDHPKRFLMFCNWKPTACPLTIEELRSLKIKKLKK